MEEHVHEKNEESKEHHKKEEHKECKECKRLNEELKLLKAQMEKLVCQNQELDDSYKRKVAEFDNYRKRMLKQTEDAYKENTKRLILEVLPIFDNFERAIKNSADNKDFNSLFEGLKITHSQINVLFDHWGIKPMEVLNKEFDPNLHEAVLMEEREELEKDNTIVQELEKGYTIGELVLRHSKVKVAKKKQIKE
jgi:molecular chaperone GrpE